MSPVSVFLLVIAAIFLVGVVGEWVFAKSGVPDVVWLILVGLLLGPVGGLVGRDELARIAPYFGALTLVVILFEGGSRLELRALSGAAARSVVLAVLSFVTSVSLVAAASLGARFLGWLPAGWTLVHGLTLGSILGGSSSVVIMPAMQKAGLAPHISNLVTLESALTDVLCVVCTVACIHMALSGTAAPSVAAVALAKSFGIGLGAGLAAGLLGLLSLRMLRNSAYAYPLTLGALMALYVLVGEAGGSGALAILAVAVLLGNARSLQNAFGLGSETQLGQGMQAMHSQLAFIIKSFFFTFIGAMLAPPWSKLAFGGALGLLLLLARVPAAYVATVGSRFSSGARGIVLVTLPRGMAAGVLALFPFESGMSHTSELPAVVYAAVLCTILLFAVGFPFMRRRLEGSDLEGERTTKPIDLREGGKTPGAPGVGEAGPRQPESSG